ncbi:hypothetical protein BZZ01_32420 [Nostocales cyanobacterium HT-58-2]|nr:hypothetical protein BZZ01_32420 [Nostocales cyanobacterium HT-58-2]
MEGSVEGCVEGSNPCQVSTVESVDEKRGILFDVTHNPFKEGDKTIYRSNDPDFSRERVLVRGVE